MEKIEKPANAREMLGMNEQVFRKAQEKATAVIRRVRVNPTSDEDEELVRKLEEKYRSSGGSLKDVSNLFEAAFIDLVDRLKLFGENTEVRYSPYDDFTNGVDAIIVIKDPQGRAVLAVGLDVTFSDFDIDEKLGRIKFEIENDTLATIKYPGVNEKPVDNIPRCLVALNLQTVGQLIRLWVHEEETSVQKIRSHHAFRKIVTEIHEELGVFAAESKSYRSKSEFGRARKHFEKLLVELPPLPEENEVEDAAFERLTYKLKNFKDIKPRPPAAK